MPTVAGFATDLMRASRRLVRTVPAVLDASFHPFRTVREGTRLVQGLLAPEHGDSVPPPTEAAAPAADHAPIHRPVPTAAATSGPAQPSDPVQPSATAEPPQRTVDSAPAPAPAPDLTPEPEIEDRPIQSRGPAPHVPPAIAAEVERDYGDEIPGIMPGQ